MRPFLLLFLLSLTSVSIALESNSLINQIQSTITSFDLNWYIVIAIVAFVLYMVFSDKEEILVSEDTQNKKKRSKLFESIGVVSIVIVLIVSLFFELVLERTLYSFLMGLL